MADASSAEGPVVPKRILVGGPPSDLPGEHLTYPGKPLAHRFIPTETVRRVEETRSLQQPKLATDVPFKPVASVAYPDKNIHLAPVSNTRARGLQPVALDRTLTLPTSDSRVFELSQELHPPLEARLDAARQARLDLLAKPPETRPEAALKTADTSPKEALVGGPSKSLEATHSELERLKELARQELAAQPTKKLTEPAPGKVAPPTTLTEPTTKPAIPAREADIEIASPAHPENPPVGTDAETKRLLSEAGQLEAELVKLRQGIVGREEAPPPPSEDPNRQIDRLVLDKNELQKTVGEITNAYNAEVSKRRGLESLTKESGEQLAKVLAEKTKLADQLKAFEQQRSGWQQKQSSLEKQTTEESTKRQELETKLEALTKDFGAQLQKIALEKANLADQLRAFEEQRESWQQSQGTLEKQAEEINGLSTRLKTTVMERDESRDHLAKLGALLEEIRLQPKGPPEPEAVVKPQIAEAPEPKAPTAKIIKPQAAIGRMAPSLTSAPNVINGIVKDANGLLLSNAIIVVKDGKGEPVRALKTNKIGQFAISTPLPNGTYTMELEAPGRSFDIIQVDVKGKVMPPIEIRSNN